MGFVFLDNVTTSVALKIKTSWVGLGKYFKRLLFPIWLFPIKLVTYSTYYIFKFVFKLFGAMFAIFIDALVYPFRSIKNFLKAIVYLVVFVYFLFSIIVIADYITREYGTFNKLFCDFGVNDKLKKSVVRIIGGYAEGSGFFINDNEVVTNFHVIAGEPSPKVVFPDGSFETPIKIVGDKNMDLAVLTLQRPHPDAVYPLPDEIGFVENEPLLAAGYPLGSEVTGNATIVRGNFIDFRKSKKDPISYIQTNLSLVKGMSGGPLVDQCGNVVGVNTQSLAGISFFLTANAVKANLTNLTDQEIAKIEVDPSKSPESAVVAYYAYLKARRMEDGFKLLSTKYLEKTNFTEWTNRFVDILDVEMYKYEKFENTDDTVFIKFSTRNWVDGEVETHYYEGTWQTILEDGVYKMLKSKIVEITDPGWGWYYE